MKRNGFFSVILCCMLITVFSAGSMLHTLTHYADHLKERLLGEYHCVAALTTERGDSLKLHSIPPGNVLNERCCRLFSTFCSVLAVDVAETLKILSEQESFSCGLNPLLLTILSDLKRSRAPPFTPSSWSA